MPLPDSCNSCRLGCVSPVVLMAEQQSQLPLKMYAEKKTNLFVLSRQQALHDFTQVVKRGSFLWFTVPAFHHDLIPADKMENNLINWERK